MSDPQILADFRTKFRVEELLIAKTPSWSWSVRPAQATLGAGVLSLNRHAARFSEVSAAEMAELSELVATAERALKADFDYDLINYLMLMMVDPHVHFHVIPRYRETRQFAGLEWSDSGWPGFPALAEQQHRDDPAILGLLRDALLTTCTK